MYETISSAQNPRIRNLVTLMTKSRERRKQNMMVIEGAREFSRAIASGVILKELYYCSDLCDISLAKEIKQYADSIPVYQIRPELYSKLAYREGSEGIIALAEPKTLILNDLMLPDNPLVVILESVEKPGNLGAVMRTADAAGVDAVIVCDPLTDLYNPNIIRSSVGCIFTRQVAAAGSEEVMQWLKDHGIQSFAAALADDSIDFFRMDYHGPTAFVMGTEAKGLSQQWMDFCDKKIIIPMMGVADSLNVSVSTAVLVYEAFRQRNARLH